MQAIRGTHSTRSVYVCVCVCFVWFVWFVSGKGEKALKKCVSVFICGEKVVFLALVC